MAALYQLDKVCFDYHGIPALRDLTLDVAAGERLALLGANGSGKSTLLRMLDALVFPRSGALRFDGAELTEDSLRDENANFAFRRRVALVFQNPEAQLFNPTVFDEVAYGPLQLRWERDKILEKTHATMRAMDIEHLAERPPHRLSGGEKKRVALASALVLDPDVLLLDEPTAALDPRSQCHLLDLIAGWRADGRAIITATHQLEIVEDLADRVCVMEEGRLRADGATAEILNNFELLLEANLAHAHRHRHGAIEHAHPHRHGHEHQHGADGDKK